ncbi:hypothetical protein XH87_09330 [Bradyrhizobium sp. CCBAU 53415]|nr:hypothetical protein [Bradyrhizobium sp. CCBAU 53415]
MQLGEPLAELERLVDRPDARELSIPGRFDESNRVVHNTAACLLLLHKATTAPASRLHGPRKMLGLVVSSVPQAE